MSARRTAVADQLGAAARDAEGTLRATAARIGQPVTMHRPGPFVRGLLADLGPFPFHCGHLRSPGLSFLLAWSPDRLRCAPCAFADVADVRGTAEDRRCDLCRRTYDQLWTGTYAAGPTLVTFGACSSCFRSETGTEAA